MSWEAQLMVYPKGLDVEDEDGTEPERRFFESEMERFFQGRDEEEERPVSVDDVSLPRDWYRSGRTFDPLYIGVYNFFPLQEVLDFLQAIVWKEPEWIESKSIQVIVGGDVEQDGMDFRVIKITYESETVTDNA